MREYDIAVKQCYLPTLLHQQDSQDIGDRGFTGPAEPGKPNAKAALMCRRG